MSNVENIFDINSILKNSFSKLEHLSKDKKIELIFEMHSTIPRELKGDVDAIERLLSTILTFVFQYTAKNEIVLSLNAPEDFLYEELISFKIEKSGITKEKVLAFLETELGNSLTKLEGEVVYDECDIHLNIPFSISELGFRRHYRLPSKSMLQKKVLLIVESDNVTQSISKMFKYFPYDVDIGFQAFQKGKATLEKYDVVIIEDHLVTDSFVSTIQSIKNEKELKYVLLGDTSMKGCESSCACLLKPVTQESIFELIVSLFQSEERINTTTNTKPLNPKVEEMSAHERAINSMSKQDESSSLSNIIEKKKSEHVSILDTQLGMKNAQAMGLDYGDELEKFVDTFDKSDLYFRQIVNEKATNKIKEFCIDLEKQSKIIGAESMQKFADIVSLIFVYDKLDMLPIYPGRFHLELDKLIVAIKRKLYI